MFKLMFDALKKFNMLKINFWNKKLNLCRKDKENPYLHQFDFFSSQTSFKIWSFERKLRLLTLKEKLVDWLIRILLFFLIIFLIIFYAWGRHNLHNAQPPDYFQDLQYRAIHDKQAFFLIVIMGVTLILVCIVFVVLYGILYILHSAYYIFLYIIESCTQLLGKLWSKTSGIIERIKKMVRGFLTLALCVIKYIISEKFIKSVFIILYFPAIITLFISEETATFFTNMKFVQLLGKAVSRLLTHEMEKLQEVMDRSPYLQQYVHLCVYFLSIPLIFGVWYSISFKPLY